MCKYVYNGKAGHQYNERPRALALLNLPRIYIYRYNNYIPDLSFKPRPVMGVTTGLVFLSLLGKFFDRTCLIMKCNLHHCQLVADDSLEISRLICSLKKR